MKPLDRALIAWSKGNFVGTIGSVYMVREYVFHEGVPVCARFYDTSGDPFIFFMPEDDDQYAHNPVNPAKHLKGRKWYPVMNGKYQTVREHFALLERSAREAKTNWRALSNNDIYAVGEAIEELRKLAVSEDLDIFISSENDNDTFLLGAKHLLRGRAEAVTCESTDQRGCYNLNDFIIHDDFGNALLQKMKKDGVTLHDLTR